MFGGLSFFSQQLQIGKKDNKSVQRGIIKAENVPIANIVQSRGLPTAIWQP
jgi:hypothetical protein